MEYFQWFRGTLFGIGMGLSLLAGASWIIDPIELWEAPVIRGLNHIKPNQGSFMDVFKPFQVRRHAPDVIYIGTSRVYVGIRPEENAYNMGGSSLSLPDMRSYLRFIYSQHTPQKVFIGLDLFQFSRENMTKKRNGFSQERLDVLQQGDVAVFEEAWKTSLGMTSFLKGTIQSSYKNWDKKNGWERGWEVTRGERTDVDNNAYYYYLYSFWDSYTKFVCDSNALLCVRDIVNEAEAQGVEIFLFFNPVSVDLLTLQSICGRAEEFRVIKNEVAKLHPVYDFAWVTPLAMDREGVWLDGSHYHYPVGDKMKASMTGEVDAGICRVLAAENVETQLQEEALEYERWAAEHSDYIQVLAGAAPQKIPVGMLAQYLGF